MLGARVLLASSISARDSASTIILPYGPYESDLTVSNVNSFLRNVLCQVAVNKPLLIDPVYPETP